MAQNIDQQNRDEAIQDKRKKALSAFTSYFRFAGFLFVLFSIIELVMLLNTPFSYVSLYNVVLNLVYGALYFFLVHLLNKRDAIVVQIVGVIVILGIINAILFGGPINIIGIALGGMIWLGLWGLKREGELH